jgi:hypothetical protein
VSKNREFLVIMKSIMSKLEDKCDKMPIGHRYTGTFYLRKAYKIPFEGVVELIKKQPILSKSP